MLAPNPQAPEVAFAGPVTKTCKRCARELPIDSFYRVRVSTLSSRCRFCHGLAVRHCVMCGAEFQGRSNAKLCSDRCRRLHRPPTFLTCRHCGRTFGPVNHLNRVYCSTACKALGQAVGRRPPAKCNPKARSAQRLVRYYIESGRLQRPEKCSWCGRHGRIEAAHENYDRPLEVRWLCQSCHRKWDWAHPKGGVIASDGRCFDEVRDERAHVAA